MRNDNLLLMQSLLLTVIGGWAIIILFDPASIEGSLVFAGFGQMMPLPDWGMLFAAIFAIGLICRLSKRRVAQKVSTHLLSATHCGIAVLIALKNPLSTGTLTYGALACFAAVVVCRDQ
jgi:hypothetical protein